MIDEVDSWDFEWDVCDALGIFELPGKKNYKKCFRIRGWVWLWIWRRIGVLFNPKIKSGGVGELKSFISENIQLENKFKKIRIDLLEK